MHRMQALAACLAAAAMVIASPAPAQERQVYRYIDADGRVVYSDRAPTSPAKDLTSKRVGANFIETNKVSLATQQAADRFPVTLYTFGCGDVCQNAEALLNRRGVPFDTVNVEDPEGAKRLQQLTGETNAPVLQVGDKLVAKGFNEPRWQAMLDEAGYPKAPPSRRTPIARAEPAPAGDKAAAAK